MLYGAAGELARGVRISEPLLRPDVSAEVVIASIQDTHDRCPGLMRPEARAFIRSSVQSVCHELLLRGFDLTDLPDAFDLTEYARRWAGAQARQRCEYIDVMLPFLTRPFVQAALATHPRDRRDERVPIELLRYLSPELLALPLETPWARRGVAGRLMNWTETAPSQLRQRLLRRLRLASAGRPSAGRLRERLFVLERQLGRMRERCLDQHGSRRWEIIDRERFEFLTSDRANRRDRLRHHLSLFQALTAFEFEEELRRWVSGPARGPAADHASSESGALPNSARLRTQPGSDDGRWKLPR